MKVGIITTAMLAIAAVFHARRRQRQQHADEHAEFLGADAGGSFIHHGSVSE